MNAPTLDLAATWARGTRWPTYLRPSMQHYDLWKGIYDRVLIPGWALEGFMPSPMRRLLVIAADWCGDAANTVPVLARLIDLMPGRELRVLDRDSFPDVMNAYLTSGTRSIPVAIVLDEGFNEIGHWGPRPTVLQEWVLANKKMMPSPQRYAYAREWYARDRGVTTLRELLAAVAGKQMPA